MSELLKKQNYGVEVEFTGISRKMAADAVAEIIGTAASRPDRTCYQTRTIQDSQGRKWKVMRDSSIHPIRKVGTENMDEYRVEFVTPVLKYEDLDTLQAIIRKFREIGGVPHSSCGIHIHVDGANHTATSLRRLVNFMYSRLLTAICGVPNILFTEFMPCVSIACLTCGSEKSGEKITVGIAKFFSSSAFVYVPFTPSRALITRSFAPVIAFSAQVFFSSAMFTMTERSMYLSLSSFATTKA